MNFEWLTCWVVILAVAIVIVAADICIIRHIKNKASEELKEKPIGSLIVTFPDKDAPADIYLQIEDYPDKWTDGQIVKLRVLKF